MVEGFDRIFQVRDGRIVNGYWALSVPWRTEGHKAKDLTDGLIGLAENLRGDNAKEFMEDTSSAKP